MPDEHLDTLATIRKKSQMKHNAMPLISPFWRGMDSLHKISKDTATQNWLATTGSLTDRLRKHYENIEIELLAEGYDHPTKVELSKLNNSPSDQIWIRNVLIKSNNHSLVFARTVIPIFDDDNPWQHLSNLGTQPLGDKLFEERNIQRTDFEFSKLPLNDLPHYRDRLEGPFAALGQAAARRSIFYKQNFPLLLTEVFLPPTFN